MSLLLGDGGTIGLLSPKCLVSEHSIREMTVYLQNAMKVTVYAGGGVGVRQKMGLKDQILVRDGT